MSAGAGGSGEHTTAALTGVLEEARTLGFVGPGPVAPQLEHAVAFLDVLDVDVGVVGPFLDLGSGGGVPGLVLASFLPESRWVLLDSMVRRTRFLEEAVERLGLGHRVDVVTERAEVFGWEPAHRMHYRGVVARSFAAPPVLAECAAPLLQRGATVVVSEPPADGAVAGPRVGRWDEPALRSLGLSLDRWVAGPPAFVRLRQTGRCPRTYPRAVGIPAASPLW